MLNISPFSSPSFSAKGSNFTSRRARWSSLAKSSIGAAVAAGVLTAGQAQALVVNVGGHDWDVSTFTGTNNDNASKFATAANGGVMPWWENYNSVNNWTTNLAQDFALEVKYSLGSSTQCGICSPIGPLFAYELRPQFNSTQAAFYAGIETIPFGTETFYGSSATWAQAILIGPTSGGGGSGSSGSGGTSGGTASVPGPLPIFGTATAFGFSRKLRKRIKGSASINRSLLALALIPILARAMAVHRISSTMGLLKAQALTVHSISYRLAQLQYQAGLLLAEKFTSIMPISLIYLRPQGISTPRFRAM